jgi:hypothetical protein
MIQQNSFAVASKSAVGCSVIAHLRILFFALLTSASGIFLAVDMRAQGQVQPGAARPTSKQSHRLRISKGYVTAVSLKADKARMSEVAIDLSKRLGAKVILGPTQSKKRITVEFYDLLLEQALGLLAPRVYIDYEVRANAQPTPLAVFLMDLGDPDPAKNAVVQGSSEAVMFEGNTEDIPGETEANAEDDPLQVDFEDNRLTIKSKKQLLVAVVLTIAEVLEVPGEIKYDSTEIVDTVIKDTPFEDAITRLSPNIRLYVRADLTRSQRTPLRLKLVPPAKVDSATTQ